MSSSFWGRKALLEQLEGLLDKSNPDNVSIVAPRGMGKTALLREVTRRYGSGRGDFAAACYVDLKHLRPDLANPVFGPMAEAVQQSLRSLGSANEFSILADDIDPQSVNVFTMLRRITKDDLSSAGKPILIALDGCDAVLKTTAVPRNTWDGLCNLADEGGVRFIAGSRRRLGDLCRDDDASTSNFYLHFEQLLEVRNFSVDDWSDIFACWGMDVEKGVRDECHELTGGHPPLVSSLARVLRGRSSLSMGAVASTSGALLNQAQDALAGIWKDIGVHGRSDLSMVVKSNLPARSLSRSRLESLATRGLIRKSGEDLRCASTVVSMYVLEQDDIASDLQRLFGTQDSFRVNIRQVLEYRYEQLGLIDNDLRGYLQRAIGDVQHARFCLNQFRGLANRTLDLVFQLEAPGAKFPQSWLSQWGQSNGRWPGSAGFPVGDRGRQCQLLWEIVDASRGPRLSQKISRRSVALIDQVKSYGDLGQHLDDSVDGDIAVAACFAAIEMCESVTRDLR